MVDSELKSAVFETNMEGLMMGLLKSCGVELKPVRKWCASDFMMLFLFSIWCFLLDVIRLILSLCLLVSSSDKLGR